VFAYDCIVRTFNSASTLADTLAGLKSQRPPPQRIIVIDSGSNDATLEIAEAGGCECHAYQGGAFNYSRSLNQGLSLVTAPYVLVLSSHSVLIDAGAVAALEACLENPLVAAAYLAYTNSADEVTIVSSANFNGSNGLWNPCSLYKSSVATRLRFDDRVPACEDQHFAKRLFAEGLSTAAVGGRYLDYRNARTNRRKLRNDHVAIAAYVWRDKMSWPLIARIALAGVKASLTGRWADAGDRFALASRLLVARVRSPRFESRYFDDSKPS
jgi:glycosyltransferase involved in cell wall biosynthesis